MLESAEKLAKLSHLKHQQLLRDAAERRRAAQAEGWGLRWHAAQVLIRLAGWLSPAHRVNLDTTQALPGQIP